ncbi:MAG: hypothetical protein ACRC6L_12930 [Steroidobacteraceae bacterium]
MTAPTEAGAYTPVFGKATRRLAKFDPRKDPRRIRRVMYWILSDTRKRGGQLASEIARELVIRSRMPVCHRRPATGAQHGTIC